MFNNTYRPLIAGAFFLTAILFSTTAWAESKPIKPERAVANDSQQPVPHGKHRANQLGGFVRQRHGDQNKKPSGPQIAKRHSKEFKTYNDEIKPALEQLDELAQFYKQQERWDDAERILQQRVELSLIAAQVSMLADCEGPKTAIEAYYELTEQPEMAIRWKNKQLREQFGNIQRQIIEVDSDLAKLQNRREALVRQMEHIRRQQEQVSNETRNLERRRSHERINELLLADEILAEKRRHVNQKIESTEQTLATDSLNNEQREALRNHILDLKEEYHNLEKEQLHIDWQLVMEKQKMDEQKKHEYLEEQIRSKEKLHRSQLEKKEVSRFPIRIDTIDTETHKNREKTSPAAKPKTHSKAGEPSHMKPKHLQSSRKPGSPPKKYWKDRVSPKLKVDKKKSPEQSLKNEKTPQRLDKVSH